MSRELWSYRPDSNYEPGLSLTGYRVDATDGHLGRIDEQTDEVGSAYLVVDTGPRTFGTHVLLPAGTITRIDRDERTVHVDRTKDEIRQSPQYDPSKTPGDIAFREQVQEHYRRQ